VRAGFLIFLLKRFKKALKDSSLPGVLILPLKIKAIKYKPSLSQTINRDDVFP
jgi:hypothetical protein